MLIDDGQGACPSERGVTGNGHLRKSTPIFFGKRRIR